MKIREIINRAAHYGTGAWVGSAINDPRYFKGGIVLAAFLLSYQSVEAWRKGDGGYREIAEITTGMALMLAYNRFSDWYKSKERN